MSERAGASPAPVRSLNSIEASVNDLSATLIARLVTVTPGARPCGTFTICGTFGRRAAEEAETAE
jgi:hypothetical protein